MRYQIITGTAVHCENELNLLNAKYYLEIEGFISTNELTTILVFILSKKAGHDI